MTNIPEVDDDLWKLVRNAATSLDVVLPQVFDELLEQITFEAIAIERQRIMNHLMRRNMIRGTVAGNRFFPSDRQGMALISGYERAGEWIYETDENRNIVRFFPARIVGEEDELR